MHLLRSPWVRPLATDWRETLVAIAKARGLPSVDEPKRLAKLVAALSSAYNSGDKTSLRSKGALAARLGFSFPRDVPKSAGAVRELVGLGALALPAGRPLRILDLGAGLGASTWGVVSALAHAGSKGLVEVTCVDDDEDALSFAKAIAEARRATTGIALEMETQRGDLARGNPIPKGVRGPFDLVLLGQVLSELSGADAARLAAHLKLVESAAGVLAEDGSLVVIEPALRDRTRHLHALRDAILASRALTLFAPCLHASPCPALSDPNAWCHEDLDVDLPDWLVPVAAAAGLRFQGLTFSYLVLRKDHTTLRGLRGSRETLVRIVSEAIVTKGKREAFVCGDLGGSGETHETAPGRARAMRLDRDASESNATWDEVARGDVVACSPPLLATKPRIGKEKSLVLASSHEGPEEPRRHPG
jgi:SAM-dependent methyltransferase